MSNKILITVLGWEERSIEGFYKDFEKFEFNKCLLYIYESYLKFTANNLDKISTFCEKKGIQLISSYLEEFEATKNWKEINRTIKDIKGIEFIFLDITTIPRETIWTILFFINSKPINIKIIYHKPIEYNKDWLSREPDNPRLLYKHSGLIDFDKPTLLIILTGFDFERTRQLIWYYEPKKTILLIQKGSQFDNLERNNKENHIKECKGLTDYDEHEIDAYDETFGHLTIKNVLDPILNNYNIIASSLGPKLTGISLYQYVNKHNSVALAYVPCREYNSSYSIGYSSSIIKDIQI